LTKLRNNRYLEEFISIDISRIQRNYDEWLRDTTKVTPLESDLLFIMLDIDKLKELNDTYGHDTGDHVLIQLAEIFNKECHKSDVLIRKGGDEFLIVSRTVDRDQIHDLPERLRNEVEKKSFETGDGKQIKLTCSIGFACYPFIPSEPNKIGWNEVFKIADKALYAAKYSGRNSWVGLMSTDKTKTDNLYQRIQNEMKTLMTNDELKILTSIPCKNSIIWTK
jgi:diguanylate cyclase (GGDEF)-like protein